MLTVDFLSCRSIKLSQINKYAAVMDVHFYTKLKDKVKERKRKIWFFLFDARLWPEKSQMYKCWPIIIIEHGKRTRPIKIVTNLHFSSTIHTLRIFVIPRHRPFHVIAYKSYKISKGNHNKIYFMEKQKIETILNV